MSSKLWIASRPIVPPGVIETYFGEAAGTAGEHLYVVYDPDGDPTTGDEQVWRGGPESLDPTSPNGQGNLVIENWVPIANSEDDHHASGLDPFSDRNFTELDTGSKTPEQAKADMEAFANAFGTTDPSTGKVDTGFEYGLLGPNSNGTVASGLATAGIDVTERDQNGDFKNLPNNGLGHFTPNRFPGVQGIIDSPGDDDITVGSEDDAVIYDGAGNDTITVEKGARVAITNDNDPNSSNTIIAKGYNSQDVTIAESGDDTYIILHDPDGNVTIIYLDNHNGENGSGTKILIFEPDENGVGGGGFPIDLDNPPDWAMGSLFLTLFDAGLNSFANAVLNAFGFSNSTASPLVLDLDGNGIDLEALVTSNVFWDIDEDGFVEHTGWTAGNDGFLAHDRNNDGVIDSHAELFGSMSQDGFSVLSEYDTNLNGLIDSGDDDFSNLIIWQDLNQNGISETGELQSLGYWNIVSIDLNASMPSNLFIEGHNISHVSSYTVDDGVSGPQTLEIVDVWFGFNNTLSHFVQDYTLDPEALFLTTMRGYGDLPDLHITVSSDNDDLDPNSLGSLLNILGVVDMPTLLGQPQGTHDLIRDIMFRWAGVDNLDPLSRGAHVDARELVFMEKITGQDYLQFGTNSNPGNWGGQAVHRAFEITLDGIKGKLIAQVAGAQIFNTEAYYDPLFDSLQRFTNFEQNALDDLRDLSNDTTQIQDKVSFWVSVINVVEASVEISSLTTAQYNQLEATIQASDDTLSIALLQQKILQNYEDLLDWTPEGDYILGTSADDVYSGSVGNDFYDGGSGSDTLLGSLGDDTLRGNANNDVLDGQFGNDVLEGGHGNDIYRFNLGHGHDIFYDTKDDDTILFGAGITAAMITVTRLNINDVLIEIDGGLGGSITLHNQTYGLGNVIEAIEFDDGSTLDLTALDLTLEGTSGNDVLYGVTFGGSGVDTLYGHEGNDTIYGYRSGVDTDSNFIYGGDGNDTVYAAHGVDLIYGDAGDDRVFAYNGNDTVYGGAGSDTLFGGNHDDVLYGGDGDDFLYGDNNNDILYGGAGLDELTGGGQNDTFVFEAATSFDAVDIIKDFSSIYDAIDISDVISAYDPLNDLITDFVQITDDGSDSMLSVDVDGGADNFVAIALIDNRTGLTDEVALENSGALITA